MSKNKKKLKPYEMDLRGVHSVGKKEFIHMIKKELAKYGYTYEYEDDGYIYAKGELPVLLSSHMDTVQDNERKRINVFYDEKHKIMWSPDGLGADDRAGCLAIFELLKLGHRPSILFCDLEEKGGKGGKLFIESDHVEEAMENNYMIGIDRQANMEAVFYDCENKKFWKFIESFGFSKKWGSFSDIATVAPILEIASANVSAGFYHQHTAREFLDVVALQATILTLDKMLKEKPRKFKDATKIPYHMKTDKQKEEDRKEWNQKYYGASGYDYMGDNCVEVTDDDIDEFVNDTGHVKDYTKRNKKWNSITGLNEVVDEGDAKTQLEAEMDRVDEAEKQLALAGNVNQHYLDDRGYFFSEKNDRYENINNMASMLTLKQYIELAITEGILPDVPRIRELLIPEVWCEDNYNYFLEMCIYHDKRMDKTRYQIFDSDCQLYKLNPKQREIMAIDAV